MSSSEASTVAPNVDAEIGRRVHQLMWDRRITQTAFGARVGMDQSSVAKRLRGKLSWSAAQVVAAADALGTTVGYLFGETTEAPRPRGEDGEQMVRPLGLEPRTH